MLNTINDISRQLDELKILAEDTLHSNPELAIQHADKADALAVGTTASQLLVWPEVIRLHAMTTIGNYAYVVEHAPLLLTKLQKYDHSHYVQPVLSSYATALLNSGRIEESVDVFLMALELIESKDSFEYARTKLGEGFAYFELGKYIEALQCCDTCDAILEKIESDDGNILVKSFLLRAKTQFTLGNYSEATRLCLRAIEVEDQFGRTVNTVSIYTNISVFAHIAGDYDKALQWSEKALETLAEKDAPGEAIILCNMGNTYIKLNDYKRALQVFQRGYEISFKKGDLNTAATALHGVARVYETSDPDMAISHYMQALELRDKAGIPFKKCVTLISLADVLREQGEFSKADTYLGEALQMAETLNARQLMFEAHKCFAEMYKTQQQWEKAYRHLERVLQLEKQI
ncbi:MAG TPA: tetratricopeptide repeat protein, partial [Patescibacteria group bacterium]|nr:tetratricopeptide repeat protein [Patescibacteria group bacterium]